MSVQPTNSSKYQEFHGVKLANGAVIANFVVEKLAAAPTVLEAGRSWYNTSTNVYQYVESNGTKLVVKTVTSAEALAQAISDLEAKLASTDAGKGAGVVGFVGQTGTNGKFSVAAGTVEDSLKAVVSGVDAEIKRAEDEAKADRDALAASTGAGLVGYEGQTGAKGVITVAAGTVAASLDSLVDQVDAKIFDLGDDKLSKSTLVDQAVASNVTFAKNVVIKGDISVLGDKNRIEGNVVELGDNIILLNREVLPDAEPVADAGLSVNRGIKGELNFILWDESAKYVSAPVVTVATEANVDLGIEVGDEIIVQSRVILGVEFDAFDAEVTHRLEVLEEQVNGKIGDLTLLHTATKENLVVAINEVQDELDKYIADVANKTKGATLVAYAGKAGANSLVTVAEGTVSGAVDSLVIALDAEMKSTDEYIASLAANTGSSLVGFVGQGVVADAFYLPAGKVDASLGAIVTAIKEDREDIKALQDADASLVSKINASKYVVVSPAAQTHTITHNLNSSDISVDVWFKDGASWLNHQASCKIVDANTIEFTLTTTAELKVLVKKFDDLVL